MSWATLSDRWKEYFRQQLWLAQSMSKDANTKVGSLIIDTNSKVVVASGWNDLSRGVAHTPERNERPLKYLYTCHSEQNCLMNALRLGQRVNGLTMLCTLACCAQCSASVVNSGIGEVVTPIPDFNHISCGEQYAHSVAIMREGGVQWVYDNSLTKEGNNERPLETDSHSCAGDVGCCSHSKPFKLQQERAAIAAITRSWGGYSEHVHTGIDERGTTLSVPV